MILIIPEFCQRYFCDKWGTMTMQVLKTSSIKEIQESFTHEYPFLSIDFYKHKEGRLGSAVRQKLQKSLSLGSIGMKREGIIQINDTLTVRSLEEIFLKQFGLHIQVSRRSGSIWLETTMTNNWTLQQQNTHGKDLSEP
jgi:hypothetical protein